MNRQIIMILIGFLILFSCGNHARKQDSKKIVTSDSMTAMDRLPGDLQDKIFIRGLKPIYGYRFKLIGDFNGDGKSDTLTEHFVDRLANSESPKTYEGIDYNQWVGITIKYRETFSFMTSNDHSLDTLILANGSLGVAYMKNEGDLNGDGGDEISYVIENPDWSSWNACYIASYRNKKWTDIYSFDIWDWQVPELPLIKDKSQLNSISSDTFNLRRQNGLETFEGFVQKMKSNIIKVRYRNDESMEDTMIVDLRKVKKPIQ